MLISDPLELRLKGFWGEKQKIEMLGYIANINKTDCY